MIWCTLRARSHDAESVVLPYRLFYSRARCIRTIRLFLPKDREAFLYGCVRKPSEPKDGKKTDTSELCCSGFCLRARGTREARIQLGCCVKKRHAFVALLRMDNARKTTR